jgi:hypothetical protein
MGALLKTGSLEIESFINDPESAEIARALLRLLGGDTSKYLDGGDVWHTIKILINNVTK